MTGNLPPVDSAFISSTKVLPEQAGEVIGISSWADSTVLVCAAALCMLLFLCSIRLPVNLLPSLIGCMLRWKENVNLENSTGLRRERNRLAILCIPVFCLLASVYRLFEPSVFTSLYDGIHLLCVTGVFLAYAILRLLLKSLLVRKPDRIRKAAANCSHTFFILTAGYMIVCAGVAALADMDFDRTRQLILVGIALIYTIFLIRKSQIFSSCCNFFSTLLYLCALEFLPTGALVALAVLL